MRKLAVALALVVLVVLPLAYAVSQEAGSCAPSGPKPEMIISLTSGPENLHSVVMGLHFAEEWIADGGKAVIFFNVKAPPLARKDLPDGLRFRDHAPVKEMIAKLLAGGAKMVVCSMCAQATDVTAADLTPGIEMITNRKQIFDYVHANTVVFTY